MKYVRTIIS